MTDTLTPLPRAQERESSAPVDDRGAWVKSWNWGLTLALTVMIAPTLFSRESLLAPPPPLKTPFAKVVEAIALALLFLWLVRHRWLPRLNLPMALCVLFVGWSAVSGFWAEDQVGFRSQFQKLIHSFATTAALYVAIRTRRDLENAVVVWKLVSFVYAGLMLAELVLPQYMLPKADEKDMVVAGYVFHRTNGPSGHANWAGFFLGATLCLQPYFWLRYRSPGARALLVVITLTEGYALVAAHVRLGVLGLLMGGFWWVARGAYGSRWKPIVLALVGVVVIWPFLPESWKIRTTDADFQAQDRSIEVRLSMQQEALRVALAHGGLGTGYGGFGYRLFTEGGGEALEEQLLYMDTEDWQRKKRDWIATMGTHNAYLEVLIETGVLGIVLFLGTGFVLYLGLFSSVYRNKGDPEAAQLGLVLECMAVSLAVMLTVLHAQERRVLFTMIAIASAYVSLTRYGLMSGAPTADLKVPPSALRFAVFAVLVLVVSVLVLSLVTDVAQFGARGW